MTISYKYLINPVDNTNNPYAVCKTETYNGICLECNGEGCVECENTGEVTITNVWHIPTTDDTNRDCKEYKIWLSEGNTPSDADPWPTE